MKFLTFTEKLPQYSAKLDWHCGAGGEPAYFWGAVLCVYAGWGVVHDFGAAGSAEGCDGSQYGDACGEECFG